MSKEDREKYSDFSNVEKQRNYVTAEDYPEGPYGSPFRKDEPVEGKSTPWREGQRSYSNFNYEFKSLHQGTPRKEAGAHPTHDDPNESEQPPYSDL
ncbi:cytosolic protein [Mesobacillus subterraneus]|uniref:cytosolic protein n=1 Tax=Mesobacillus subterraneus TaxID=285983 RepID=UPI001CFEF7C6|nr:cytosolic protein [Mesobacillus subterraneus]